MPDRDVVARAIDGINGDTYRGLPPKTTDLLTVLAAIHASTT